MAGHSKWANIQHRKNAQDARRGKLFTKLIREIFKIGELFFSIHKLVFGLDFSFPVITGFGLPCAAGRLS